MFNPTVLDKYVEEEAKDLPNDPQMLLAEFRRFAEQARHALAEATANQTSCSRRRLYRDWTRNHDLAFAAAERARRLGIDLDHLQVIADEFGFEPLPD